MFIKVINNNEDLILLIFIIKDDNSILRCMIVDINLYKNITLIINEVAYINNNLVLNWFCHFIKNVWQKHVNQ